jgi:hypothetical protein
MFPVSVTIIPSAVGRPAHRQPERPCLITRLSEDFDDVTRPGLTGRM